MRKKFGENLNLSLCAAPIYPVPRWGYDSCSARSVWMGCRSASAFLPDWGVKALNPPGSGAGERSKSQGYLAIPAAISALRKHPPIASISRKTAKAYFNQEIGASPQHLPVWPFAKKRNNLPRY